MSDTVAFLTASPTPGPHHTPRDVMAGARKPVSAATSTAGGSIWPPGARGFQVGGVIGVAEGGDGALVRAAGTAAEPPPSHRRCASGNRAPLGMTG